MIDERETERRVEAWLLEGARPMPQHVLEASIEAVARTGQVGAYRPAIVRWLGDRRVFALAGIAAVLVVAVVLSPRVIERPAPSDLQGLLPGATPAPRWDPAVEFRTSPGQTNPGPDRYGNESVWSYMRSESDSHDPTAYTLLPDFRVQGDSDTWFERDLFSLAVGHIAEQPSLWFHPWSSGVRSENHHAILRWRSPITGRVEVGGRVEHTEPSCVAGATDGTTLFLDREGETLEQINVDPGQSRPFETTIDVEAGQSLFFVVDPGRASNCDTTELELSIVLVAP